MGMRNGMVRANSSFDHAILFGLFCALTIPVFLYRERSWIRRGIVGVCFLGARLALTSAALMVSAIMVTVFLYDQLLQRSLWRWKAIWVVALIAILVVVLVSQNPLDWILNHLTLDPQTGYYRMMIWNVGLGYVAQSPLIGYSYRPFNTNILLSVDSVWLLETLRFGIPMLVLFLFANVTSLLPNGGSSRNVPLDEDAVRMRRAFTLVLVGFMFGGLTVHFWNFMWMFWGLCIGIRASLKELTLVPRNP
jgi:hypothetical protein